MYIYLPVKPSTVEQNAATELSTYLQKAYGEEFPIQAECGCEKGIYVGFTNFAAQHGIHAHGGRNELNGTEAWVVCATEGSLVLTGGNSNMDRGIIYAVEHYLEDVIGVRFWNSIEEYVPTLQGFSINPALALSGEPYMTMRFASAGSAIGNNARYAVRRRMNYNDIPLELGGCVLCSSHGHCHTLERFLHRDGLFEQHPDWFAWSDNTQQRQPFGQYCLNNEGLIEAFEKAFLNEVAATYAKCDAEGKARPHHFHLSPDDTGFACQCPACKQSIARSGPSGNLLRFVNRIARAAKKVYPNIVLEMLAYWNYSMPPLDDTVPESNVRVRIANINSDMLHGLAHPNNSSALQCLTNWAKACRVNGAHIYVWDYNVLYVNTPAPNADRIAENLGIFAQNGVDGLYVENETPLLADFWALKHWLLSHLMEDPFADTKPLINSFMHEYYGPAAGPVQKWFDISCAAARSSNLHMECCNNYSKSDFFTWDMYIEGDKLLSQAEKLVSGNDTLTLRVRQLRAALDMSVCTHYDTLHYLAQQRGCNFPIPRELAGLRYALTINQTEKQLEACDTNLSHVLPDSARIMHLWQSPYKPAALPPQFEGTNALQIDVSDFLNLNYYLADVCHMPDDASLSGYAVCLDVEKTPQYVKDLAYVPSRTEERGSYSLAVKHGSKWMYTNLRREDLTIGEYALYHIADLDDLSEGSNTYLRLCNEMIRLHISCLADIFPGKKLSFWVRAKYLGPFYGGDTNSASAVFFDRVYVVPGVENN